MGAENFKAFFKKHAKEYHVADSAVMDLEQLTDMDVTTTLIPPQKEQAAAEASYPCIILLIENMDQEVTFEP